MLDSPSTADVFELLGSVERENAYTSLIAYLLKASEPLRARLIQEAFGRPTPPASAFTVERQVSLDPNSTIDILLEAIDPSGKRWALFVEAKIHASEQGDQTPRYVTACVKRVGGPDRVAGVFLTLTGAPARQTGVPALKHSELAAWVDACATDFSVNPALQAAAAHYVTRARAPLPNADDSTPVRKLLERREGLIPRLAGADALAAACTPGPSGPWEAWSVWIQGRGHANPGLVFRLLNWVGTGKLETKWTPDNYNLHLEVELIYTKDWRLKLHFETNPYLPQRKLNNIEGWQQFIALRDKFREILAHKIAAVPGWKLKGKKLQVAVHKLALGPDPTVGQFRAALTPALQAIAPIVSSVLAKARQK